LAVSFRKLNVLKHCLTQVSRTGLLVPEERKHSPDSELAIPEQMAMADSKDLTEQQMVFLDPALLERGRIRAGLALGELADKAEVDYRTVRAIYRHGGLLPSKAKDIADTLGCEVLELLAPWDPRYVMPHSASPWLGEAEWERLEHREQGRQAANGLYYIVCQMRHRHTAARRGRGKFYVLSWLRQDLKAEMRHKLSRHADVCALIKQHPHIAVNLSSAPTATEDGWWVVDDWVGDQSLADRLEQGSWPREKLPQLLHQIALGLSSLHAAGVIFRELAPSRVLLADADGRAVLTDFELAKLLEGVPSVSADWPEDPFRAPEVDSGIVTPAADVYSLGRLAAAAIAGRVPERGEEERALTHGGFPKRLWRMFIDSVAIDPGRRPADLAPMVKELARLAGA
jgi:serine/threonine protein kinase